jgi:hypothetical protein
MRSSLKLVGIMTEDGFHVRIEKQFSRLVFGKIGKNLAPKLLRQLKGGKFDCHGAFKHYGNISGRITGAAKVFNNMLRM